MLPSGTVTFLFTDIEGSTARWETDAPGMRDALGEHNAILKDIAARHSGSIFKTVGDAFCIAFASAEDAAAAALAMREGLAKARDPLRIRIGLHTAAIVPTGDDYFGPPLNRVARILAAANGGQILLSEATKGLLPSSVPLLDLGVHTLRDLLEPARLWQLGAGDHGAIRSLSAVRNNLPLQTTTFIGRDEEMKELFEILNKSRLITLTGAGGTGKSRLALQFAAENLDRFPDGVWLCELSALSDRADVVRTILSVLGVSEGGSSPYERLMAVCASKRCLIVIDNCEHVLDEVLRLAEGLVANCASVTVLATSREPLGARGEATFRVPSLSGPDPKAGVSKEGLGSFASTALFLDRFSLVAPTHRMESSEAVTVARICQRLDGIPLAIELAAARGGAMSLGLIEKRLDDRFRLLTGGSRNALPRHQTLRALIDWSVRLLDAKERSLLICLSVFCGEWNVEAVQSVCAGVPLGLDPWEAVDTMTALVDKSLVVFNRSAERYSMLESIRQYALDELERDPAGANIRDRHAHHFLAIGELFAQPLETLDPTRTHKLSVDYENFRAAVEWSAGSDEGLPLAVKSLCQTNGAFYDMDRAGEFIRLMEPIFDRATELLTPEERGLVELCLANSYVGLGDPSGFERCFVMKARLELLTPKLQESWRRLIGYSLFCTGQFQGCVDFFTQRDGELVSHEYRILGQAYTCLGLYQNAVDTFLAAQKRSMAPGNPQGYCYTLHGLVMTHLIAGNRSAAVSAVLDLNRVATQNKIVFIAPMLTLTVFGNLALDLGDPSLAAICGGGVAAILEHSNHGHDPIDRLALQTLSQRLEEVPEAVRSPAEHIGRRLDWEPWLMRVADLTVDDILGANPAFPFPELLVG